jgi:hypothetical protein
LALDKDFRVTNYPPQYLAAEVITKEWVQPVDAPHRLFRAASDLTDDAGNVLVTAYAVARPDGQWSVLLVNKDRENDHEISLAFADEATKRTRSFDGAVERITFGAAEYQWHQTDLVGHADPDGPPARTTLRGDPAAKYVLPKASVVVLRGKLPE